MPRGLRSPLSFCERLEVRAERARKRRFAVASEAAGAIYLIGGRTSPVKIGFTNDLAARLLRLQMSCPIVLSVLASYRGTRKDELEMHQRFRTFRLHGEWFERCPEIEAEIERLSDA